MSSSEKPAGKTDCIDTLGLDSVSRERYDRKIQLIGGVDPYHIATSQWSGEPEHFPDIAYPDIVKHSQSLNATPLKPWIIAEKNGDILAGHCDCVAGLREVCSHVGAMLFYVDAMVKLRNSKTVTQEPAYWMLPSGIQKVEYAMVKNINFKSAKSMRNDFDNNIEPGTTPRRQISTLKMPTVTAPTESEIAQFYRRLHNSNSNSVILSLTPEYSSYYVPSCLSESFPTVLTELYDEKMNGKPLGELLLHCENVFKHITVSQEQSQKVELETRSQSKCKSWYNFRQGRVTASRMKAVCSTSLDKPSASLIKSICYPYTQTFSTEATKWGCKHESTALAEYISTSSLHHDNLKCESIGLIITPTLPYIGASPDSSVSCECCGDGVVEIKCPFCIRSKNLSDIAESKSCLELVEGQLKLKHSHPYYYQVQTQIHISGRDYCDFVVWTEKGLHIEGIEPDYDLWKDIVKKAELFFKQVILPQLVAKYFLKPQPSALQTIVSADNANNSSSASDSSVVCICQQPYDDTSGRVIGCDNQNCKYQWLHFNCINLKRAPKGAWYCPECRKLSQYAKKICKY